MKLINNFYHIVAAESFDEKYICKVKLNAEHDFYRVHFPGNPVTPGVCLVQMATEILEQEYHRVLVLCKANSIKFKRPVGPNEMPLFLFTKIDFEGDKLSTRVSIEDDNGQLVKMVLEYSVV